MADKHTGGLAQPGEAKQPSHNQVDNPGEVA
jgi:hypothetical protein